MEKFFNRAIESFDPLIVLIFLVFVGLMAGVVFFVNRQLQEDDKLEDLLDKFTGPREEWE